MDVACGMHGTIQLLSPNVGRFWQGGLFVLSE
jgi:hypothetical protein